MYWDKVLKEVLNKKDSAYPCLFTNLKKSEEVRETTPLGHFYERAKFGEFKAYLGKANPGVYFTRRECQCMLLLLEGKTMKEIGVLLELSARTVEYYVKNMKIKTECRTKSQLIGVVLTSEFIEEIKKMREQKKI